MAIATKAITDMGEYPTIYTPAGVSAYIGDLVSGSTVCAGVFTMPAISVPALGAEPSQYDFISTYSGSRC